MDYLDRPTTRRFVIVRPQDKPTKRRTSRSSSASSVESAPSSKGRTRSISQDDVQEKKTLKRQSSSPATPPPPPPPPPQPSKRRSPSPPSIGRTFYGPFGSYFSTDDAANVINIDELINFCEKLSTTKSSSVYPVQFNLKSHAYDARMHFMAGSPQLANDVLRQYLDAKHPSTELKITQRHHLDQQKMEDMEKKIRTSVSNASTRGNTNGQSSSANESLANQTNFAVLITSPTARKSNGRSNSPNHQFSSDENEDRSRTNADDESSLSNLISYLAG